jgi:hypothetical protein
MLKNPSENLQFEAPKTTLQVNSELERSVSAVNYVQTSLKYSENAILM